MNYNMDPVVPSAPGSNLTMSNHNEFSYSNQIT